MDTLNYVRQCSMYFDKLLTEAVSHGNIIKEEANKLIDILNTAKKTDSSLVH